MFKLRSALGPSSCSPKCFKLKDSSWAEKCCTAEGSLRISHKTFLAHLTFGGLTLRWHPGNWCGKHWFMPVLVVWGLVNAVNLLSQFRQGRRVIVSSWRIISGAEHIREEVILSYVLPFLVTYWENNYCVWVTNDWDKMWLQCVCNWWALLHFKPRQICFQRARRVMFSFEVGVSFKHCSPAPEFVTTDETPELRNTFLMAKQAGPRCSWRPLPKVTHKQTQIWAAHNSQCNKKYSIKSIWYVFFDTTYHTEPEIFVLHFFTLNLQKYPKLHLTEKYISCASPNKQILSFTVKLSSFGCFWLCFYSLVIHIHTSANHALCSSCELPPSLLHSFLLNYLLVFCLTYILCLIS